MLTVRATCLLPRSDLFNRTDNIEKEAFETGYKAGMEEGIRQGMSKNFERSAELSEEEYDEVIGYLVSKGLELCCYDVAKRYDFKHIRKE